MDLADVLLLLGDLAGPPSRRKLCRYCTFVS